MARWITETTRYERISAMRIRNLPCPVCGKKYRRQRTFTQTVNPWNKNDQGLPKTWHEVETAVNAEADDWARTPERHPACVTSGGAR